LFHRPELSGCAVHGEVDELDIGEQHGWRFVLSHTYRPQRRPYPFVQVGAQTPDTGAEAVEPDTSCSWEDHSGVEGAGVGDENAEELPRLPGGTACGVWLMCVLSLWARRVP